MVNAEAHIPRLAELLATPRKHGPRHQETIR